ncbi:Spx/MgsR family RNA polymerase-binding regulatory protein [Enterococcus sp. LJL120]
MITLYIKPTCNPCRKVKTLLSEADIPYVERDFFSQPLTSQELEDLIALTENGVEDLLLIYTKIHDNLYLDYEGMSTEDLAAVLAENPRLLRRPLIVKGQQLLIGFEEISCKTFCGIQ